MPVKSARFDLLRRPNVYAWLPGAVPLNCPDAAHGRRKLMNWYYEKEGVSQGPCPETEIVALARRHQVVATTLIWHPGLDEWDSVEKLKPEWLEQPEVTAKEEVRVTHTVPKTEGPLPTTEAPATSNLPKPKAGLEKPAEPVAKGGLLGRLFGRNKKPQ
ncbi:MAG: hypothetical protein JWO94_462 [Verrucomicrobiaceae bacterium]|nr:hypothetical protein [Verrucomicrobiaceae bacterium]